jgi:hypothetical protein
MLRAIYLKSDRSEFEMLSKSIVSTMFLPFECYYLLRIIFYITVFGIMENSKTCIFNFSLVISYLNELIDVLEFSIIPKTVM